MGDHNPSDQFNTWIIAAHVAKHAHLENLVLRNTAWLPAKPDFVPLTIMMLAPKVQMKLSEDNATYKGFVCGVGYDQTSKIRGEHHWSSICPNEDIEIDFDHGIGLREVLLVEDIRAALSKLLSRDSENFWRLTQTKFVEEQREIMKKNIEQLLYICTDKHNKMLNEGLQ